MTKNDILLLYKDFPKFMNINNMPDLNPIIYDNENDEKLAYILVDEDNQPYRNLYVNKKLLQFHSIYIKSILFHEFMHIYDSTMFYNMNIDNQISFQQYMTSFSEYHASKVELLSNLGYSNVKDKKSFNLEYNVYYENEKLNIDNYLIYPLSSALAILYPDINANNTDSIEKQYIKFKNNLIYYLGKYDLCIQKANMHPHDFFDNFNEFKSSVIIFYKCLKYNFYSQFVRIEKNLKNEFLILKMQ